MFPTGAAGIALFILRVSTATALLFYANRDRLSLWGLCAAAVPATALCLGFLTPYVSAIAGLVELALIIRWEGQAEFPMIISIFNTAALGLLGPGAYSMDARIFGRRIMNFSTHDKPRPS
jgi:hypothetical protein